MASACVASSFINKEKVVASPEGVMVPSERLAVPFTCSPLIEALIPFRELPEVDFKFSTNLANRCLNCRLPCGDAN